jgi:medium-chain acyl-[acyl-carrier-protein] hydrolase
VDSSPWLLRRPGGGPVGLRLFCFPYAGGGASPYAPWKRDLPAAVEVCPVQLPGRENRLREPAYTRIAPLIDATWDALRPYLDLPCALFGHSMGAFVAFEFARRMRREGVPGPLRLFVSAHRAPHLPSPHPPIAHLPDGEFLAEVQQRYDGVPEEILREGDLIKLLLPTLRADMALIEEYRCADEPPLECPVSALGGHDDREAEAEELAAWRHHTSGPFSLDRFAGGHFYLRTAGAEVLALIRRDLAAVVEPAVVTTSPR